MPLNIAFEGKLSDRMLNLWDLLAALLVVTTRRASGHKRQPGWDFRFEFTVTFMKRQTQRSFRRPGVQRGREYSDALVFTSDILRRCRIEAVDEHPVSGRWFTPPDTTPGRTLMYIHGGGFVYYGKAYDNMIAQIATAARTRTFALDYRLAPEYPYPLPLEDALSGYRWLLAQGAAPAHTAIIGDSAGGNLTLALLQTLRRHRQPQPGLGILLCPWLDLANSGESMTRNAANDWIDTDMLTRWAKAYCNGADLSHPYISPLHAELHDLPPLYIQAGTAEILHDSIQAFIERAQQAQAQLHYDFWPEMVHDFQGFGALKPESKHALEKIALMLDQCL